MKNARKEQLESFSFCTTGIIILKPNRIEQARAASKIYPINANNGLEGKWFCFITRLNLCTTSHLALLPEKGFPSGSLNS